MAMEFLTNKLLTGVFGYLFLIVLLWAILRLILLLISHFLKGYDTTEAPISIDIHINGVSHAVSYWSERGGRPYQEDRYQQSKGGCPGSSLYGVFDGHGGSRASQYCKEFMLQYAVNDAQIKIDPKIALRNAFFRVDAEFSAIARLRGMNDGSTAIVGLIQKGKIYVANAGDSRAILVKRGGRVAGMSIDHKPNREDEEIRIKSLGGKVVMWGRWRVQGVLAVSRAIGDVTLQPYVTCEPEILEKEITVEDEYLVLASDGVWDVMQNEEVGRFVQSSITKSGFETAARVLCDEAIALGSTDNVTALVIDLRVG